MTPAAKRYSFAFTGFMLAYAGVVIGVPFLDRAFDFATPVRIGLALLPVVPTLFALREFMILLHIVDEVQRRIQLEAILIAAAVVGFGSFAWGFVEGAIDVPRISLIWVLPALAAVWGAALPFVRRRYV